MHCGSEISPFTFLRVPRKGLGNNLAWKCLAGMAVFKSCKLHFQIFNTIGQVLLQFSKFLRSTVYSLLSLVELKRWLAEMHSFPHQHRRQHSSAQDTLGKVIPQTLTQPEGSVVQTNWSICTYGQVVSAVVLQ